MKEISKKKENKIKLSELERSIKEKKLVPKIPKDENEKILQSLGETNFKNSLAINEFKSKVNLALKNYKWLQFTQKSTKKFERIFDIYRENIESGVKEDDPKIELGAIGTNWSFKQFYMFCRDYQICPDLIEFSGLKSTYQTVQKMTNSGKNFGPESEPSIVVRRVF